MLRNTYSPNKVDKIDKTDKRVIVILIFLNYRYFYCLTKKILKIKKAIEK